STVAGPRATTMSLAITLPPAFAVQPEKTGALLRLVTILGRFGSRKRYHLYWSIPRTPEQQTLTGKLRLLKIAKADRLVRFYHEMGFFRGIRKGTFLQTLRRKPPHPAVFHVRL